MAEGNFSLYTHFLFPAARSSVGIRIDVEDGSGCRLPPRRSRAAAALLINFGQIPAHWSCGKANGRGDVTTGTLNNRVYLDFQEEQ